MTWARSPRDFFLERLLQRAPEGGRGGGSAPRLKAAAFRRILEADEPPHQGVVPGVGGVRIGFRQLLVEAKLRLTDHGVGHRQADPAQAISPDRDQQRGDRLDPPSQIGDPFLDQIAARERFEVHTWEYTPIPSDRSPQFKRLWQPAPARYRLALLGSASRPRRSARGGTGPPRRGRRRPSRRRRRSAGRSLLPARKTGCRRGRYRGWAAGAPRLRSGGKASLSGRRSEPLFRLALPS